MYSEEIEKFANETQAPTGERVHYEFSVQGLTERVRFENSSLFVRKLELEMLRERYVKLILSNSNMTKGCLR